MVFWFVIRTLKYNVFYEPVLRRYSWYGYYVPLLSIPSLSVIAALKMRESENQKRRQWTGIFLVITVGVILLVMTNDLHQLVFRFPAEKPWTDDEYFYGPGFVLCVAWIAIGFLTMLGILIAKCRNPGKKKIWLPFVPLGLFFIWCIANIFRIPHLKIIAGDMAAACCLLIAALFESCIQCGLILVNNRYGELFQASRGINAQISDRNLNIRYTTGDGIELDKEEMKEALENPGYEKEGIRLNSIPINGGYAFWIEDIRQHRAAYESLYELREESKPAFETGISKRKREKTGRRKEPALRSDAKADGRTISADCRICGSAGTVYGSQGISQTSGENPDRRVLSEKKEESDTFRTGR